MDLNDTPSQTPPIWPRGPISYAIAQLSIEFPFTDSRQIKQAAQVAAEKVAVDQGPTALLRHARELLRAQLSHKVHEVREVNWNAGPFAPG